MNDFKYLDKAFIRLNTPIAGDGSFRERKKFKEFCEFRLNLLIKISHIPDLKKF